MRCLGKTIVCLYSAIISNVRFTEGLLFYWTEGLFACPTELAVLRG